MGGPIWGNPWELIWGHLSCWKVCIRPLRTISFPVFQFVPIETLISWPVFDHGPYRSAIQEAKVLFWFSGLRAVGAIKLIAPWFSFPFLLRGPFKMLSEAWVLPSRFLPFMDPSSQWISHLQGGQLEQVGWPCLSSGTWNTTAKGFQTALKSATDSALFCPHVWITD